MKLNRDVLLALSTVIWATGDVTPGQAAALSEAARASGLDGDDLCAVERATREPVQAVTLGRAALSEDQRMFAYGLAAWLARANGQVFDSERGVLARLGNLLGLSVEQRMRAAVASREIGDVREGDAGEHDVPALARALRRHATASGEKGSPSHAPGPRI